MTFELWTLPLGLTVLAFGMAARNAVAITEGLGSDGFGVVARLFTWCLNLLLAAVFSGLAWLIWWSFT